MISLVHNYFGWLQKDNPTGGVERYPETDDSHQSSVEGVYITGDLTGVPLLKLASENGAKLVRKFAQELRGSRTQNGASKDYSTSTRSSADKTLHRADELDVLIVGAGPAGLAAALECETEELSYEILEASKVLNTIENFPKGKLILAKPDELKPSSQLIITDGNKESLLEDLKKQIQDKNLNITKEVTVQQITRKNGLLEAETSDGKTRRAKRVILAIGKSGNARRLKVPGEDLPKVFNKLFDPGEFKNQNILVVGGGDSALETSVALAGAGNKVTHSYRKKEFARPKPENLKAFEEQVTKGNIKSLMPSEVLKIEHEKVTLKADDKEQIIDNDAVFTMIGRELPLSFFKRSGIKMEGEKSFSWYVYLVAMLSFFTMLYFGKAGFAHNAFADASTWGEKIAAYFTAPFIAEATWQLKNYTWYNSLSFYLGWLGSLVWMVSGTWALSLMLQNRNKYFGTIWNRIKYSYLTLAAIFYTGVYFIYQLGRNAGWVSEPTYWYSFFYCTTMALFAVRRAQVRKTRYITIQMATVVFIQVFFLFLLPFHLYEPLIANQFSPDSYIRSEIFPNGGWSSFALILFWPLNINTFGSSTFWTWFPFVQTFGILYYIVYRFGKGGYCSWICSCGGMAESLGDEYRQLSPHGPTAKKWENIGQVVLAVAVIATFWSFLAKTGWLAESSLASDTLWGFYKLSIDVFFAGVMGLGVYFFLGGRIWCRYGCPLAALMHIYTRFSRYRILSEKKKCISCNICTKVCHMGIDVMSYANKGTPMNDVECVRCSACVQSCPTEVLSFAELEKGDLDNEVREEVPAYGKEDWKAGIR